MLYDLLKHWQGRVVVNDKEFKDIEEARSTLSGCDKDVKSIKLLCSAKRATERKNSRFSDTPAVVKITVRQYMTKPASPDFDFMAKWTNNIPMPLRTMVGSIEKETPGMVYMKLHGDLTSRVTQSCMKCGRPITNPVSQFFGMGPECGGHNYVNPFESEEELLEAVETYRKEYLQQIKWEGWVIKSSIIEKEVLE